MRSSHSLDLVDTAFDGTQLVADAGLLLPATLAAHLGLKGLADRFLDLGRAAGRANVGDKLLTLVFSAPAGGDCIDDAAALRAGGRARVLGFSAKALARPSRSRAWSTSTVPAAKAGQRPCHRGLGPTAGYWRPGCIRGVGADEAAEGGVGCGFGSPSSGEARALGTRVRRRAHRTGAVSGTGVSGTQASCGSPTGCHRAAPGG